MMMKHVFSHSFIMHFIVVTCHFALNCYLEEHPLRNHRELSSFIIHKLSYYLLHMHSLIFLLSPTLSNDPSRSMFNTISQDYHSQIFNRKPFALCSSVFFMYVHKNIINAHRIDTIH